MVDRPAPGVRADDLGERAMAVDVVETGLRVVLDDEDRRLGPEPAPRDRLDDPAEGQVVVGDRGAGVGRPGLVPEVWSLGKSITIRLGSVPRPRTRGTP